MVVGLMLYQKGNRIGLQIAQAIPEFNKIEENVSSRKIRRGPEDIIFHWKKNMSIPIATSCLLVTGAALYLKGNHMAIRLLGTKIDVQNGQLTGPIAWQDAPGGASSPPTSRPRITNNYCDNHRVVPPVSSCSSIYAKGN